MSIMDRIKAFFAGGSDGHTHEHGHDHAHDHEHGHAHVEAPVIEDPLAAPGMPVDPVGTTMPESVPAPAREDDET